MSSLFTTTIYKYLVLSIKKLYTCIYKHNINKQQYILQRWWKRQESNRWCFDPLSKALTTRPRLLWWIRALERGFINTQCDHMWANQYKIHGSMHFNMGQYLHIISYWNTFLYVTLKQKDIVCRSVSITLLSTVTAWGNAWVHLDLHKTMNQKKGKINTLFYAFQHGAIHVHDKVVGIRSFMWGSNRKT